MFKHKNSTMTSIFLVDKESSNLQFRKDELAMISHLDSISDHIIDFSAESNNLTRALMPVIDLHPDKFIYDFWQAPYLKKVKGELQDLIKKLNESYTQHVMRKQLKLAEDPWDNYLIHDSKYFMPILCHS